MKAKISHRLIQHHVGHVLQHELAHVIEAEFFTITNITWHAHELTVYISMYHSAQGAAVFKTIQENTKLIRHHLAQRLKKQVHKMPKLRFVEDVQEHTQQQIESLLERVRPI